MKRFLFLWIKRLFTQDLIGSSIVIIGIALCSSMFLSIYGTSSLSTKNLQSLLVPFGSENVAILKVKEDLNVTNPYSLKSLGTLLEENFEIFPYEEQSIVLSTETGEGRFLVYKTPILSYEQNVYYADANLIQALAAANRHLAIQFKEIPAELASISFAKDALLQGRSANDGIENFAIIQKSHSPNFSEISEYLQTSNINHKVQFIDQSEAATAAKRLTGAFERNIMILVIAALLVTSILSYQLFSLRVVVLAGELGTLRTFGLSHSQLFTLVTAEALVLGLIGAVVGMLILAPLSSLLSNFYQQALMGLYASGADQLSELTYSFSLIVITIFVAVSIATLGALVPALRLSRLKGTLGNVDTLQPPHSSIHKSLFHCIILLCCFVLSFWLAREFSSLSFSYVASAILVPLTFKLAGVLSNPVTFCVKALAKVPKLPFLLITFGWLRSAGVELGRGAGVTALAFSLIVGMSTMIDSFRETVSAWARVIVSADLYIRPHSPDLRSTISSELLKKLESDPRVEDLYPTRFYQDLYGSIPTVYAGIPFSIAKKYQIHIFLSGDYPDQIREVLLSESTARKMNLDTNDTIEIQGRDFFISGVVQDFSTEHGLIYLPDHLFEELFSTRGISTLSVYLREDLRKNAKMAEELESDITRIQQYKSLEFFSSTELRSLISVIFEGTFTITYFLRVLLLGVTVLGITTLLLQSVQLRLEELRTMFAIGASLIQIRLALISEAVTVAIIAGLAGTVSGLLLAKLLTDQITPFAFGWSLPTARLNFELLIMPWLALISAGVFSAILPARKISVILSRKISKKRQTLSNGEIND